ncbi:TPA: DUF551 domain-containing protein [Klebsiella quasipneumoniae subsp. similipneumoniae]
MSDEIETIDKNPKSWAAWKREAERMQAIIDGMALAAMDSEPVAWLLSGGGAKNVVCFDSGNAYADPLREVTPLYRHAQLAPVVPDKWIPVSERIPEDRKQVILWDAEIGEVTSGHYSHKTQTFYHCGDAIENEITHWMPPPCAPQEVK